MSLPRFGVRKPVPVNLLMLALLIGGLVGFFSIRREFFPETDPEAATIALPYPGATPEEIESTLARKVEDAIIDIDEVDEIRTTISEGGGGITVQFREGTNIDEAVDDLKQARDALLDLPNDAEEITVAKLEPLLPAVMVTLFGDVDELALKQTIRAIRDDLRDLDGMGSIQVSGVRDFEHRVDVDYHEMIKHGISLPQIADAISQWTADVPGGTVRSRTGNTSVRTTGVSEEAHAIRDIVIKSTLDGQSVRIGDVATVRETFADVQMDTRFNGKPSATLTVFSESKQDIVEIAEMVKGYVAARRGDEPSYRVSDVIVSSPRERGYRHGLAVGTPLPRGAELVTHSDLARFVQGRLELLSKNAFYGALLVFGTLFIFLNWRGALWVGAGLTTALAGTLLLMQAFDITLNLLTMFGLIVVLGLLVDDAIVVAENIQARHDQGESSLNAAINGANQVAWPVLATVLTSIVAFLPLTFIRGQIGDLLGALPVVVACALLMSLIESLLILPSHLGHSLIKRDRKQPGRIGRFFTAFEKKRDDFIFGKCVPAYSRLLQLALRFRYVSVAIAFATLIASIGLVTGGRVVYRFLPGSDAETVVIDVRMPIGTSINGTEEVVSVFEDVIRPLRDSGEVTSLSVMLGVRNDLNTGTVASSATHIAQLFMELAPVEQRDRDSGAIITAIRESMRGRVDRAERITYQEISGGPGGSDITIELLGMDTERLQLAADEIKATLADFAGVYDIADDNALGQREVQIQLRPGAAPLGFTVADVARQVRGALFGLDAHVFQQDEEDIDVRVRLNEETRESLYAIESMWLINPQGRAVPLSEIAELTNASGYATIHRVDRKRAITVTAATASDLSPQSIVSKLPVSQWREDYPDITIRMGGQQEQQSDAFASLPYGFGAALIMIYVILAWLFSSYIQPIAVMLAIPFGIIGVIWGHYLLGYELTFLSMIGFVALSGIVVNDSLILVKFYNDRREEGMARRQAIVEAGERRLRPIFLTTVTTVLGLTPLMLEQSFQAKFLIPMAIAIAAGLMSATVLILLVLPCILTIVNDVTRAAFYLWHGRRLEETPTAGQMADVVAE